MTNNLIKILFVINTYLAEYTFYIILEYTHHWVWNS